MLRLPSPLQVRARDLGGAFQARIGLRLVDVRLPRSEISAGRPILVAPYEAVAPFAAHLVTPDSDSWEWGSVNSWKVDASFQRAEVTTFAVLLDVMTDDLREGDLAEFHQSAAAWSERLVGWVCLLSPLGPLPLGSDRSIRAPLGLRFGTGWTEQGERFFPPMPPIEIDLHRRPPVEKRVLSAALHQASWHETPLAAALLERARSALEDGRLSVSVFEATRAVEAAILARARSVGELPKIKDSPLGDRLQWLKKQAGVPDKVGEDLRRMRNDVFHSDQEPTGSQAWEAFEAARDVVRVIYPVNEFFSCTCAAFLSA